MSKQHTLRLVALVMTLGLIAAACGDSEDAGSNPTAAPATDAPATTDADTAPPTTGADTTDPPDTTTTAEPAPARTGTLKWALASNGANFFDPHVATNPFGRSWMYPFYDRLTQIDQNGAVQPMLAESWEFSADGASLTFNLRDDAFFHDGTPFDAEAAVANIERARNPEIARGTFIDLLPVESAEVVDTYVLRLNLKAPGGALPAILSDQAGMMISPAAFDNEDLATMPVGAGPFRATEFRVDEVMFAEAFEDYWDPELPKVQNLELRFILDPTTRLNAVADGSVDGGLDRKSTRLNSSHTDISRMPSSA